MQETNESCTMLEVKLIVSAGSGSDLLLSNKNRRRRVSLVLAADKAASSSFLLSDSV